MNKLYAISIFLILFSISSQAQQLKVGIKGGLSLVDVDAVSIPYGLDYENQYRKVRASYHVGAFSAVNLSKEFYLLVELLYANKGFRFDYPGRSKSNLHLHYLTVPVLLNYKILERLHGGLGGIFGYRLAARSKLEEGRVDVSWIYDNKFDLGINVGLKYEINDKIGLGVRYTHGLSNLFKERGRILDINGKTKAKGPKLQNRELQFSVGYILGNANLVKRSQNTKQDVADKKGSTTYLGFKIGMSETTIEGSIVDGQLFDVLGNKDGELERRKGVNFGFLLKHEFITFVYIKTGLNYLEKGGKVVGSRYVYDVNVKLNYLNLPIVVELQPISFRSTRIVNFGIEAGASYNFILSKDTKSLDLYYSTRAVEHRPDQIEYSEPIDAFFGANLEIKLDKKINLFINYRQFKDVKEFYKVTYVKETYAISSKGSFITTGLLFNLM